MITKLILLTLLFLTVFGGALLAFRLLTNNPIKDRLEALKDNKAMTRSSKRRWLNYIVQLASPLAKLSVPEEGWETSPIRLRFINAGWRTNTVPGLFYGGKTGLALLLPLLLFLFFRTRPDATDHLMLWLLSGAAAGYYLPNYLLSYVVKRRQREIAEHFSDALDLMTVCVEAGLGMDAALARVADEIGLKSLILAEEMQLVTLELRAGSAKDKALRNLALRTGVEDVEALVTILIQAERFGTSVAGSLRVQSDQLRTKRRQRVEEQAAKVSLKLLLPLIFFIFPCVLLIMLGPPILGLIAALGPTISTMTQE